MNVEIGYLASFAIFLNCVLPPICFPFPFISSPRKSQYSSLSCRTLQVYLYLLCITSTRKPSLTLLHLFPFSALPQQRSALKGSVVFTWKDSCTRSCRNRAVIPDLGESGQELTTPGEGKASPFSRRSPEMRTVSIPTNESKPLGNSQRRLGI